jgi:photosystem II stability/assembly factor-like uncharacterized protein
VIDPHTPTTLYAGTLAGSVFKSVDAGSSWKRTRSRHMAGDVDAIAIDPFDPETIYAASNYFFELDGEVFNIGGIAKSDDGGNHWVKADDGLGEAFIFCLSLDLSVRNTLYAGTSEGVFKSTNGSGWLDASAGVSGRVRDVVVDPKTPTTLYVATAEGVFISIDGGNSWNEHGDGLPEGGASVLAVSPTDHAVLYAGTEAGLFAIHLAPSPIKITGASVSGKKLFLEGKGFARDAAILLNGKAQKTKNDHENPTTRLIGKRVGLKIKPGDRLYVRNPDGSGTPEFIFAQ